MSDWFKLADSALSAAVQVEAIRNQNNATASGQQATVETVQKEQVVREVTASNLEGNSKKLLMVGGGLVLAAAAFMMLKK